MAIDLDSVRWSSIPSILPEDGLPNVSPRPTEFKDSGLKNNQPLPLQWINGQFNDLYLALQEAQAQIDGIVGGSSQPTLEIIYPVDSLFMSFSETDPATYLGFGTWVAIEGKFLVGVDTGDTDYDVPLETGGTKSHTHTDNLVVDGHVITVAETPSVVGHAITEAEMPAHTHTVDTDAGSTSTVGDIARSDSGATNTTTSSSTGGDGAHTHSLTSDNASHTHGLSGGVQSNSNLVPYLSVHMFRRTA